MLAHIAQGAAWVADDRGAVVGYAVASVVDGCAHLDQVSVDPAAQGRGIGAALVSRVVDWARERGLESVTLTTFRDVPWNAPYYARLGFEVVPPAEWGAELARVVDEESWLSELHPRVVMRRRA